MKGIFMDITDPILVDDDDDEDEDGREQREFDVDTAHNIRTGLLSAPRWILETHKLSAMNLEFRKECGLESVVQSLSAISKHGPNQAAQTLLKLIKTLSWSTPFDLKTSPIYY
ncbi:hypothetical protein FNV43_RR07056 [Rhamnella rubrinervis]|uniref:Acyl-ACP thioesterase-like C-terminal domain-containing protein n=1 Tax=Rhamnella rubrinervis TaxID=2594499 RepID=A0A8K0MM09_9ROSA|nr:hypothetical protein FNV43_RR07056 [Rhamnella rubrinervis]